MDPNIVCPVHQPPVFLNKHVERVHVHNGEGENVMDELGE